MNISLAQTDEAIARCFPVMVQLRPHLLQSEFVERVRRQGQAGFHLAVAQEQDRVLALAGFRFLENLAWGKFLYVDDLISDETARGKGYAHALMEYLLGLAKTERCNEFHLDSGVQRFGAHRFYLRHALDITCHHFAVKL